MSEAVAYKVRCAACGKSLRVSAADAGTQTVCRACGSRLEVPIGPLLSAAGAGDVELAPIVAGSVAMGGGGGGVTRVDLAAGSAVDGSPPVVPATDDVSAVGELASTVASPAAASAAPVAPLLPPLPREEILARVQPKPDAAAPVALMAAEPALIEPGVIAAPDGLPVPVMVTEPIPAPTTTESARPVPVMSDWLNFSEPATEPGVPPPIPEPRLVYATPMPLPAAQATQQPAIGPAAPSSMAYPVPAALFPAPAPALVPSRVLRPAQTEGPDREEDLVPLMLDRSAEEPNWPKPVVSLAAAGSVAAAAALGGSPANGAPANASALQPSAAAQAAASARRGPPIAFPPEDEDTQVLPDIDLKPIFAQRAASRARGANGERIPGGHPFWWGALGVATTGVAVFIVLLATGQVNWFQSWESQAAPQVQRLKSEAEAMAGGGAVKDAHERYRQIETVLAGREVRDPELKRMVEEARRDARRVYDLVLAQVAEQTRPPEPEPEKPAVAVAEMPVEPAPASPSSPIVSGRVEPVEPPVAPPPVAVVPSPVAPSVPRQNPLVTEKVTDGGGGAARPAKPQARRDRPEPRPIPRQRGVLTDEQIGQSIQDGVNYLLKQFDARSKTLRTHERGDNSYYAGMDALAVYALLQAGQAINDPRLNHRGAEMKALIDAMKALPIDGYHQTYARGLRSTCLALFNRPEDFKMMQQDVDWLLGTTDAGAYTYNGNYRTPPQRGNFTKSNGGGWDNSNSQYGLLGVWSAIEAEPRIEVPLAYWKAVERHWSSVQSDSGEWGYHQGGGRLSMTSAGLASLFVAHEYLEPALTSGPAALMVGREPFPPALKKGLAWFERGANSVTVRDGSWWGYILYGIERVGLASGFKHFGGHDWYRELADQAVRRQSDNGSWSDSVVDTSYALLFLARGRHPILMNKLRFEGYWANRPRDVANVARFAGRQLERPINWQVVNADNPWTDWTDSPIVFIASHQPPSITDEHVQKLRKFVEAGGMVYTHADASSPAFDKWARELAAKLFPKYELALIPVNHSLWSTVFKITNRPPVLGVSNGSRLLMVHSPTDLALKWQQREDRRFEAAITPKPGAPATLPANHADHKNLVLAPFHFGVNLFVYAAGKRDLRNRLDSAWVEAPSARPIDTIRVARLQYGGNWDPEPGAWVRYGNWFHRATGMKLEVEPLKLADLKADTASAIPVAHLTGTAKHGFTDAEAAGLRAYVEGGGVVIIEPTGGMNAFDLEVRERLITKAFPADFPRLVDPSHPLLTASGAGMDDLGRGKVRPFVTERMGNNVGTVQVLTPVKSAKGSSQGGAVVLTSLDLSSGLLGTNTWGVFGFDPAYAQGLVKNTIFWALDGAPMK